MEDCAGSHTKKKRESSAKQMEKAEKVIHGGRMTGGGSNMAGFG